jgi:hypothetical protein
MIVNNIQDDPGCFPIVKVCSKNVDNKCSERYYIRLHFSNVNSYFL